MEQDYRQQLESVGAPRVLLVERGAPPPPRWDDLEDWLRVPVDRSELELRATTVARRADALELPWLDDDGLLWMRDQWCAVTDGQIPLVRLLVDHIGVVVRDEQVDEVFVDAGTSAHEEAIKTTVRRVSQTLGRLGLRLQRVRGAGYHLDKMP
jgi:DNA-binding response OmpR family regulator